jgi:iron-sulfur cluster repair protein YtfE (RIC family)
MRPTLASMAHSILDHHRRMHEAIVALESTVDTADEIATPRGVAAACVVVLRHELASHFASEEEGGLFEQIERNAPETAVTCERLRAQHAAILADLDRLRDTLPPSGEPIAKTGSWAEAVRALLAAVEDHEHREDDLLIAALDSSGAAPD